MSRPLSGSRTANATSSNETCGQRRAASSTAIRSAGTSISRSVASDVVSKPSSRWANHTTPASTKQGSPTSSPKAIHSSRASRDQRT